MRTKDGINDDDWDRVRELAEALVMHADDPYKDVCLRQLLSYLDELEAEYGARPGILATRADYIDDRAEREILLLRAYGLAEQSGDRLNALYIAHSLAELYVAEKNVQEGSNWLYCLRTLLNEDRDDAWLATDCERLVAELHRLNDPRNR